MEDLLQHLEIQIKKLVECYGQTKLTNQQLRQGNFLLARERDILSARQQKAIHRVESLITKLKTAGES
jgi:uncharacterized protein (TIGR02449 family)